MKTIAQKNDRPTFPVSCFTFHAPPAFTIIELLVVITIIGILAGLLLPALAAVKKHALITQAKTEISQIAIAVQHYDSIYGRYPVSPAAQTAAAGGDFTYGGIFLTPIAANPWPTPIPVNFQTNNAEIIAILMDATNYPNGTLTVNTNHQKNPQQQLFLSAKMSGYDSASNDPQPPGGVDKTGVYRDPWGNPYVISLDLNYDENCEDAFYRSTTVSTNGNNGLILLPDGNYAAHSGVMVWSAGPDKKVDPNAAYNTGFNRDNIVYWP